MVAGRVASVYIYEVNHPAIVAIFVQVVHQAIKDGEASEYIISRSYCQTPAPPTSVEVKFNGIPATLLHVFPYVKAVTVGFLVSHR